MNCSECQAQLSDLSAEALASDQSQAMRQHFEECSHCYGEWAVFERTLFIVSTLKQPIPSPLATEQMWHRCSEHIFQKVEAERQNRSPVEYSATPEASSSKKGGWFARQPRWSWASLAGAFAILAAVLFFSPGESGAPAGNSLPPEGQLVSIQNPNLENPPTMAAGLVTHHAAMTIDPFTNHVGTAMVAYSAASNSPAQRR